jgi:hypothetical protein
MTIDKLGQYRRPPRPTKNKTGMPFSFWILIRSQTLGKKKKLSRLVCHHPHPHKKARRTNVFGK